MYYNMRETVVMVSGGPVEMSQNRKFEITKQRSYKVLKANEMVQKARYNLSITELKLLAFVISKIKPTDEELIEYSFSIKDFCQVCGIDYANGKNYNRVKALLKGLRDKSFWMTDENGHEVLVGWLQKAKISKGSGVIKVKLDEDMQKYVIGLFDNFTQYELLSTLPMKSAYSFRIYEILKSYAFTKQHSFRVDDLKSKLGAEHYKNFKDFRNRVLDRAVKEINLYTDIEISWEPEYYGRKVEQVIFHIKQKDAWGNYEALNSANNAIESQIPGQMTIFDYYK